MKIGIKSFTLHNPATSPTIVSLPISLPSLTHLSLIMNHNICTPAMVSHLMALQSLTDLHLTINNCDPKTTLVALQPLAPVITELVLSSRSSDDQLLYLLPFRSLTSLKIKTRNVERVDITASFINNHWNKLENGTIQLYDNLQNLVSIFHFLSLISTTLSNSGDSVVKQQNNSLFGLKLWKRLSLEELNEFLEQMENASLLIPSLSSSPTSTSGATLLSLPLPCIPTISLECTPLDIPGEAEALAVDRHHEMYDRVQSRGYTNLSSFTIRASPLN
jgi:hypothetical protein